MDHVTLTQGPGDWIPPDYLTEDQSPHTVRLEQSGKDPALYRTLTPEEIHALTALGNRADDWTQVLVSDPFDPACIHGNEFQGLVRIGRVQKGELTHQGMVCPAGLTHSRIVNCDLGEDVAVHHVRCLSHMMVGDRVILMQCGEIRTTHSARFGRSVIKRGEAADAFGRVHVINEAGARGIGLFEGMRPADAMLWARYRDDVQLMTCLEHMTCDLAETRHGEYGEIQGQSVVKHTRQMINVKLGPCTDVINADRLEEVTVSSTAQEPVTVGEGVTLCHGLVGPGCLITQGVDAMFFALGACVTLDHGVRLSHAVVGDHSTLACCEVLHSLILPFHEQIHSPSFLKGACFLGQTHVVARATLGSNEGGQANNHEVLAGRGFRPGLCSSVKHPSWFASFVLLDRGDFPYELNITLPFSLVANDSGRNHLQVTPAHWWLYDMHTLARSAATFKSRDPRPQPAQAIETQILAPDTIDEIRQARAAMEVWVAQAHLRALGRVETDIETLRSRGRHLLAEATMSAPDIDVTARGLENSKRGTVILKAFEGYHAYGDMMLYYGVIQLMEYLQWHGGQGLDAMIESLSVNPGGDWTNLGGQLMQVHDTDRLRGDICSGVLKTWSHVHDRYDTLFKAYPLAKQQHAYAVLCSTLGLTALDQTHWHFALDQALGIHETLYERLQTVRQREFKNPFTQALFGSTQEMEAVLGAVKDDAFIQDMRAQADIFATQVQRFKAQAQ
ncbi:MAG: DUF4954 family protein [Planctomycetes bacterium]|nr:DUF4954 family protein [Planctomycetota bacterium]